MSFCSEKLHLRISFSHIILLWTTGFLQLIKYLFFKAEWFDKGIFFIKDLLDSDGIFNHSVILLMENIFTKITKYVESYW